MATLNWKVPSLLAVTLLVALGLQAGAIKILIDLAGQPNAPTPAASVVAPDPAQHSATATEERTVASTPAAREPAPTVLVADPPHLADPSPKAEPHPTEPSPEVHRPVTVVPPAAPQPSPEAATIQLETKPHFQPQPPAQARPNADGHAASAPLVAEPVAAPVATPIADNTLQEPAWLKTRNPKRYTVQLYSGKDIGTLREIAAATALGEPQAYYLTGSRSGPWYSLVAGDYPDAAAAQAAAARLTAQSPALKPWIRRFDEIQAKIR